MTRTSPPVDRGVLLGGFVVGLITGVIAALIRPLRVPRELHPTGGFKTLLESIGRPDHLVNSLQEGKEAARRRRIQLDGRL